VKEETKSLLIKYGLCFSVASLITLVVFWTKGFFTDRPEVNIQILADGFTVSGLMLTLFAGLLFVSREGALIGIGYVMRSVVLAFVPMGRMKHERYADYRARKLGDMKQPKDHCMLFTGLVFLLVGIIFTVIWNVKFYNAPV
jgi:hypothetical protein